MTSLRVQVLIICPRSHLLAAICQPRAGISLRSRDGPCDPPSGYARQRERRMPAAERKRDEARASI